MRAYKKGYGLKDGSQMGWKSGGGGRNRTSVCRHPEIKKKRKEDWLLKAPGYFRK